MSSQVCPITTMICFGIPRHGLNHHFESRQTCLPAKISRYIIRVAMVRHVAQQHRPYDGEHIFIVTFIFRLLAQSMHFTGPTD